MRHMGAISEENSMNIMHLGGDFRNLIREPSQVCPRNLSAHPIIICGTTGWSWRVDTRCNSQPILQFIYYVGVGTLRQLCFASAINFNVSKIRPFTFNTMSCGTTEVSRMQMGGTWLIGDVSIPGRFSSRSRTRRSRTSSWTVRPRGFTMFWNKRNRSAWWVTITAIS